MRVLGPIEVRVDGRPCALGPPKQRVLLAILLLHDNQVVPGTRITEELWGESPPASATANLRTYAAGLRRMLPAGERHRLVARPTGYLLTVAPEELDAVRFERSAFEGRRALDEGDPANAVRHLERALGLWRGRVGEDVRPGAVLRPLAESLEERRRTVREDWVEARLALGEHAHVIPLLRTTTAEHPLRERAWALLMRALAATGDPAAALQTYAAARTALVSSLGIEPGVELRRLHQLVLNAEQGDRAPVRAATCGDGWRRQCQLPARTRGFVGRDAEIEEIGAGLLAVPDDQAVPLVTITGPPGAGKTALAVTVAHRLRPRFPDGQWFVRLHGKERPRPPRELLADLLRASGETGELPGHVERCTALLRSRLADRRVLVVLDDAGSAAQVRPLLPGTSGSAVLVTSRDAMPGLIALDGARLCYLGALSPGLSLTLLDRLLGAHVVAAQRAAAAEVVRLCAGLPLALRIAAANISAAGGDIAAYALRLGGGDRLSALADDGDGQVSLRRSFDSSYRRLPGEARRVFRLLGVLPIHEVRLDAVAAFTGCSGATARRVVARLVAAGLVQCTPRGGYQLHDLLRLYARERADAEDPPAARDVVLERFASRGCSAAHRGPISPPSAAALPGRGAEPVTPIRSCSAGGAGAGRRC